MSHLPVAAGIAQEKKKTKKIPERLEQIFKNDIQLSCCVSVIYLIFLLI